MCRFRKKINQEDRAQKTGLPDKKLRCFPESFLLSYIFVYQLTEKNGLNNYYSEMKNPAWHYPISGVG